MRQYVVFVGNDDTIRLNKAIGYLDSLVDQDILRGPILSRIVYDDEDLWLIKDGGKLKEVIQEITIFTNKCAVIQTEVIDKLRLEEQLPKFFKRDYGFHYRIYETEFGTTEIEQKIPPEETKVEA